MEKALKFGQQCAQTYKLCGFDRLISGYIGNKTAKGIGNAIEFQEYRNYQPGDELKHLDWRVYAKTDKLIVKKYQEEIQPKVEIITDISTSMTAPAKEKYEAALVLSAFLLESAIRSESICSWWTFGNGFKQLMPFTRRITSWAELESKGSLDLQTEYALQQPQLARNSIRFFISDFLWQSDPEKLVPKMAQGAAALVLLATLTQTELKPEFKGFQTLIDVESNEKTEIFIDDTMIADYQKKLDIHLKLWTDASIRHKANYCLMRTEDIMSQNWQTLIQHQIVDYQS